MYQGEVTIGKEDLESFLKVAQDFEVRGLSEENRNSSSTNDTHTKRKPLPKKKKLKNIQEANTTVPLIKFQKNDGDVDMAKGEF